MYTPAETRVYSEVDFLMRRCTEYLEKKNFVVTVVYGLKQHIIENDPTK